MKKTKSVIYLLFTAYTVLMLWLLFGQRMGRISPGTYWEQLSSRINLIPFRTIAEFWNDLHGGGRSHAVINLVGNVIMFIPLGYFIPRIFWGAYTFFRSMLRAMLIIVCVEIVQLFTLLGSLDVDDLILNMIGAAIGYGIYALFYIKIRNYLMKKRLFKNIESALTEMRGELNTTDDDEPSDENHGISMDRARKNYFAHGIGDPRLKCKDDIHLSTFTTVDKTLGDHMPFLATLEENGSNELHIVLSAAVVGENTPDMTAGLTADISAPVADVVSKCRPILPGNKTIDIRFDNYILYQVRNESYVSLDRTEMKHGKYLCVFTESKLLAYFETVTDVQRGENGSIYPGPWRHYGIRTQNQIIDVISHFEPMVTVTESGETK